MSPPRLVLHLGQHKTGTKALQAFLATHASRLATRGVLYPQFTDVALPVPAYQRSHHRLFALLRRETMAALGDDRGAGEFWARDGSYYPAAESLRDHLTAIERARLACAASVIVLSAEDLFDLHTAHELHFDPARLALGAAQLAAHAAALGWRVALVVYLRRPDHLLAAHYAQYVKGSAADLSFPDFAAGFAPRLDAPALLAPWIAAFGAERLRVIPYEPARFPAGIVPDFFSASLGFPVPANWLAPPADPESVNLTPGRAHLEFIRRWKRRTLPGAASLHLEEILHDAFLAGRTGGRGIASWLSPAARRDLLASTSSGYAALAARFRPGDVPSFFAEPAPADDPAWQPDAVPTDAELRVMARRMRARLSLIERARRAISRLRAVGRG